MNKRFIILMISGFAVLLVLALRPVNNSKEAQVDRIVGVVESVNENHETMDIQFRLQGDEHIYHINRGLEKDHENKYAKGQKLNIEYQEHWSPLDP